MWRLVLASLFSSALASPYNPTQYDVVTNANGQIVGQLVGGCSPITLGPLDISLYSCLPVNTSIPQDTADYTVNDFALYTPPSTYTAQMASITILSIPLSFCTYISTNATFCPIIRVPNPANFTTSTTTAATTTGSTTTAAPTNSTTTIAPTTTTTTTAAPTTTTTTTLAPTTTTTTIAPTAPVTTASIITLAPTAPTTTTTPVTTAPVTTMDPSPPSPPDAWVLPVILVVGFTVGFTLLAVLPDPMPNRQWQMWRRQRYR